ncbi:MAG TPA: hydroxymethylglutaryl-CoA lyase [Hyphomicrobiaceae bacterium]|nr:hydroxymethylglutaryl-CoA lyase [Hyphomicrobiaceae bacterium]
MPLRLPSRTTVVDVAPRDGLQSFPRWVDTDVKVKMIDRLSETGLPVIEVTNFAHPRVIPHLKDAEEVCARIKRKPGVIYRGQVPNARGAERAIPCKLDELLGLITVSEAYNKKNQNMTLEQGVAEAIKTFRIVEKAGIRFVMAMGMSMWCPYEGRIPADRVLSIMGEFRNAGIRRYYLAGSLGMEDPRQVSELFGRVFDQFKDIEVGFHVHNMAGTGTANVLAALDAGASFVEGAVCGIGGGIAMPHTIASVGNLATEDIVHMLNESGVETGVETAEIAAAARDIGKLLDIVPGSHTAHIGTRAVVMEGAKRAPREHPA